ncbi:MAG TPA: CHRD domain-containing protein [Longimicrobiales bacterium]|nr:CHRD domain-containing protein [Longimicrobiales bacterium]
MDYRLDVSNLDSPTMAHIHAGAAGENGGIIVPLFATEDPVASFSGRLVTDSFTAADIVPLPGATAAMSMDSLRVLMRNGNAYVNVHTSHCRPERSEVRSSGADRRRR